MNLIARKYLRLIPALYFMLLGAFFIGMDLLHNKLSGRFLCAYAILFLPILIPIKHVWTIFGLIISLILGLILLQGLSWYIQYMNGVYMKYPFDTFVIGFPFITLTLLCALSIFYIGLKSEDNILLRKRAE